jgi:hypothetical protein
VRAGTQYDRGGFWRTLFGLWFGSLGRQVSVTHAKGDEDRIYFYYGMPF